MDLAARLPEQASKDLDRRALARPVGAEQAEHFAGPRLERNVVNRDERTVVFRQTMDAEHVRVDTGSRQMFRYRIGPPAQEEHYVDDPGVAQGIRKRSRHDAPRARTRPERQAHVEASPEIDVARRPCVSCRQLTRRDHRMVRRGRDDLLGPGAARADVDGGYPRRARRERAEGQGVDPADRRRGDAGHLDRESRRPDADVDAEGRARARADHESLGASPRPAVGVPAPARRAGAVDLRAERRREPVRRAHVIVLRRRRLHACAAVLALAVTTLSLIFSTRVAAGSDAYGYVSGNRAGL